MVSNSDASTSLEYLRDCFDKIKKLVLRRYNEDPTKNEKNSVYDHYIMLYEGKFGKN